MKSELIIILAAGKGSQIGAGLMFFGNQAHRQACSYAEELRLRVPLQEFAKGLATMTVVCLFNGAKLRERLVDLRKEEKWIVAKTVGTHGDLTDQSFRLTFENCESFSVAGRGNPADKTPGTLVRRDARD